MNDPSSPRIAVGGLHVECSTYNPVLTREDDFTIVRGRGLLEAAHFACLSGHQAVFLPLVHAKAIAGGPVERQFYETVKRDLVDGLAAAEPFDGVYLALHGAMYVEGLEDAEGDLIQAVRRAAGSERPIAVSYDLHGNLSQSIIDAIDIFASYRTAPHVDVQETMGRCLRMLVRAIRQARSPFVVWCPTPVVLSGERTSTLDEPARSLYAGLEPLDQVEGVWDASLMVGYVWADEPRATAAAVLTGEDLGVLERQAAGLATAYWEARERFAFGGPAGSIETCLERARLPGPRPFILADSGDNPTGGGVGDRVDVLRALLQRPVGVTILAGVADPEATDLAYAGGVGSRFAAEVGGALDPSGGRAKVEGRVAFLLDAETRSERQAVIAVDGLRLVLTGRRRPFHALSDFDRLELDPRAADLVVVKSGYLSPEMESLAARKAMALSPGVVDQRVESLPRVRAAAAYPFDKTLVWGPGPRASARARRKRDAGS